MMWIFSLLMYALGSLIFGISLFPGVALCFSLWKATISLVEPLRWLILGCGIGATYFLYGLSLLFVTAACRLLFGLNLVPGEYPYFSLPAMRWVLAGGLALIVRTTFIDFILMTPFMNLYLRMMGCKVAPGAIVNSRHLYDVSLLTIGDGAVIGGDAVLSCHLAEKGKLVFRPIVIGKRALIGSGAYIMPGAQIGEGVMLGAKALVLKDTILPPHTTWVGIPATQMKHPETAPVKETSS